MMGAKLRTLGSPMSEGPPLGVIVPLADGEDDESVEPPGAGLPHGSICRLAPRPVDPPFRPPAERKSEVNCGGSGEVNGSSQPGRNRERWSGMQYNESNNVDS